MSAARVLIDAGNTRLKWAVVAAGRWRAQGHADYADLSGLAAELVAGRSVAVASVTRAENAAMLDALLERAALPVRRIESGPCFGEVTNGYTAPAQLGVDRWMALIGAWRRTRRATLVISVGTAMTVDALDARGRFPGGIIVPGPALMRGALRQGTARVAAGPGVRRDFPQCTNDAVESGLVAALAGAVRAQYAHLAAQAPDAPACLVTGGDAGWLLPHLDAGAEPAPFLVLEGLACVTEETDRP